MSLVSSPCKGAILGAHAAGQSTDCHRVWPEASSLGVTAGSLRRAKKVRALLTGEMQRGYADYSKPSLNHHIINPRALSRPSSILRLCSGNRYRTARLVGFNTTRGNSAQEKVFKLRCNTKRGSKRHSTTKRAALWDRNSFLSVAVVDRRKRTSRWARRLKLGVRRSLLLCRNSLKRRGISFTDPIRDETRATCVRRRMKDGRTPQVPCSIIS